jgi:hypothetical protein
VLLAKIIELEIKMLAELLRLSKELYELEMIKESINIDNMIHKLYGVAVDPADQLGSEVEEDTYRGADLDNLRIEIQANATNEMFKNELVSIIYESFNANDLEDIKTLLTDYIE